ncbi:uncharacterized protein EV420DRAFT_1646488 [Desarmillaria tabescens]|uniref:Uncharacterized protein n=1 Tax=Armillaria tabescens TaxID=1929756 RepID=A0AA39JXE5_ARMTA|nr:uncharacterized protein EV420DRAFT_1646488 [Desarmillaria tabescens]KAK0450569.1 hypothetical protein EV420DRAFT_1646488 [Desarmillaria tabescens]
MVPHEKDGTNLKRISECLVLCARTVEEVEEYAHEDMFTDACFPFNIIDEEDDDDIYDESTGIEDHIAWMYRELSIVAEVRSRSEWIAIDADIQSLGLRGKYWDAHWDKAMAKAAIRILGLYAGEVSTDDEDEDGFDSDE